MAGRPMITPADLHNSELDPFRRLMGLCSEAEGRGALAAALLPVQPWIDVPELGWKCAVTTDGDRPKALCEAERIMDECWSERHAFLAGRRLPIDEALAEALRGPAPFVVADAGDATNGGSLGDSTELLRAALRRRDGGGRIVLSVRDGEAARRAARAGVGASVDLAVGTGAPGSYNERVDCAAAVARTYDGDIRYSHPAAQGTRDGPGVSALVRVGELSLVVHEHPVRVIDPALYEALEVDLAGAQVIQAKSHVSYRAGFAPLTERSVVADTLGPTAANLASLPYRRRPRPLFPFEDALS
jgi:microcystin degradation protein MlrC